MIKTYSNLICPHGKANPLSCVDCFPQMRHKKQQRNRHYHNGHSEDFEQIRAQYLMSPYNVNEARGAIVRRRRIWSIVGVVLVPFVITVIYRWLFGG